MPLSAEEMDQIVGQTPQGALVFVSYLAGRAPTERAIQEAQPYTEKQPMGEGMARRHFVGALEGIRTTKNGERVLTILAYNRDSLKNGVRQACGFRSFNPSLGVLLSVEVLN
jgi:hypothetical protein